MILKGKVCIDLHNHRSGFKERIEGENSITDGLSNYVKYAITSGMLARGYENLLPISTAVLGGICLSNEALSGLYLPATAQYMGGGAYNFVDTNSKYIGAYNLMESGWDESTHTYTHIWDFSTGQANGTIAALGLTSAMGGKHFYEPKTIPGNEYYISEYYIVYVDLENDEVYYVKNNGSDEHIYKCKYSFLGFSLSQSNNVINQAGEVDTGYTLDCTYLNGYNQWREDGNGNIYLTYIDSNDADKLHVVTVDVSTWSETDEEYTFPSAIKEYEFGVTSNYIYAVSTNGDYIYRYKISDGTIYSYTTASVFGGSYIVVHLKEIINGGVYGIVLNRTTSEYYYFRLSEGNTLDFEETRYSTSDSYMPIILDGGLGYYYERVSMPSRAEIHPLPNVLMSNYNLQSSITKTNTQSMRVTYNVTQV